MPRRPPTLRLTPTPPDTRPSSSARGYDSTWRRVRLHKLAAEPLCEDCGEAATEVDHVRSLASGGTHAMENLRSLCKPCHTAKTNRCDGGLGRPRG